VALTGAATYHSGVLLSISARLRVLFACVIPQE